MTAGKQAKQLTSNQAKGILDTEGEILKARDIKMRLASITAGLPAKLEATWTMSDAERGTAERVLAFLEDRRVLYEPFHLEVEWQCVDSVMQIREMLRDEIAGLQRDDWLRGILALMQASCRKFLTQSGGRDVHFNDPNFFAKLGEFRSEIVFFLAEICGAYDMDMSDELADCLPLSQ